MKKIKLLHVGCGSGSKETYSHLFPNVEIEETRLDIDENVKPDICASMVDMKMIQNESFDCIYSSHNVEHLYIFEVEKALSEFFRVLKKGGFLIISCPDLEIIAKAILEIGVEGVLYNSSAGPISPIAMLFGHIPSLYNGNLYMSHKMAFTAKSLTGFLQRAGFMNVKIEAKNYQIQAFALKP